MVSLHSRSGKYKNRNGKFEYAIILIEIEIFPRIFNIYFTIEKNTPSYFLLRAYIRLKR